MKQVASQKASMPSPQTRGSLLSRHGRDILCYALCFLLPVAVLFFVFRFGCDAFPSAGDGFYAALLTGMRGMLSGDFSPLYSFSQSLGAGFAGLFAAYLASPLSWLMLAFPTVEAGFWWVSLLRCGLCGLTMGALLRRGDRRSPLLCAVFALSYALCAFAVVRRYDPVFAEGMIFLPLLVLGTERLVREKRFVLFTLALSGLFVTAPYAGIPCLILALLYVFALYGSDRQSFRLLQGLGRFGVFTGVGVLSAMVVLLPLFAAVAQGNGQPLSFFVRFDLAEGLSKLLPAAYDGAHGNIPFLYCGMLTLLLLPLYFLCRGIPAARRIAMGGLCGLFLLCLLLSPLDRLFSPLPAPFPVWDFAALFLIFFLLRCAGEAMHRLQEIHTRAILAVCAFCLLLTAVVQRLDLTVGEGADADKLIPDITGVWLAVLMLVLFCTLLCTLKKYPAKRTLTLSVAVLLVAAEMGTGAVSLTKAMGNEAGVTGLTETEQTQEEERQAEYAALLNRLHSQADSPFYRTESLFTTDGTFPFASGSYGLSGSALQNGATFRLLRALGLGSDGGSIRYRQGNLVTDSFFGVRYVLEKPGGSRTGYSTILKGDYLTIRENTHALPLFFAAKEAVRNVSLTDASPFRNANALLRAATGNARDLYVTTEILVTNTTELDKAETPSARVRYTATAKSVLDIAVTVPADGHLYAALPTDLRATLLCAGTKIATLSGEDGILDLGSYTGGRSARVTLLVEAPYAFYEDEIQGWFALLDNDAFETAFATLQDGDGKVQQFSQNALSGSITLRDGQLLLTTIPYDAGWRAEIDGAPAQTVAAADGLLAVVCPAGEHTISLRYHPRDLIVGGILSGLGILLFAAVLICPAVCAKKGVAVPLPAFLLPEVKPGKKGDKTKKERK